MVAPFFIPVTQDFLDGRRPYLRLLFQAADALGGQLEAEPRFAHILRYTDDRGQRLIAGAALGLNDSAAARIAEDKDYTARLLAAEGLPTPRGVLITSSGYGDTLALRDRAAASRLPGLQDAFAFAASTQGAMFLKPNSGSEGMDVQRIAGQDALWDHLPKALEKHTHLRLEEAIAGEDARILVLDGRVRAAYRRSPLSVTGDGQQTVADLLAAKLAHIAASRRGAKIDAYDPRIDAELTRQGATRTTVPAAGTTLRLLALANHATGGTVEDLTDRLPTATKTLALKATQTLGLTLAGVDIIAPNLTGDGPVTIIEVNSAPGLGGYASAGATEWARARSILQDALAL